MIHMLSQYISAGTIVTLCITANISSSEGVRHQSPLLDNPRHGCFRHLQQLGAQTLKTAGDVCQIIAGNVGFIGTTLAVMNSITWGFGELALHQAQKAETYCHYGPADPRIKHERNISRALCLTGCGFDVLGITLFYVGKKAIELGNSMEHDTYSSTITPFPEPSIPQSIEVELLTSTPALELGATGEVSTSNQRNIESGDIIAPVQPHEGQLVADNTQPRRRPTHPACHAALIILGINAMLSGMDGAAANCFNIDEDGYYWKSIFTEPQEAISNMHHSLCIVNGLTTAGIIIFPYMYVTCRFLGELHNS